MASFTGFDIIDVAGDTVPLHIVPKIIGAAIIGDIKQHVVGGPVWSLC